MDIFALKIPVLMTTFKHILLYIFARCMECRRGLAMRIMSVCSSVPLSVCQTREL